MSAAPSACPCRRRSVAAWTTAALLFAACGGSAMTATRPGAAAEPVDVWLVQVTDEVPTVPVRTVSLAVDERRPTRALPERPDEGTLERMREAAAAQGAQLLLVERLDTRWRKAFYAEGLVRVGETSEVPAAATCAHPAATEALARVTTKVSRCLAGLRADRPALSGIAEAVFQVDAFGQVRRAAPTASGSRDTLVQACVYEPLYETDFGEPPGFGCLGRISVPIAGAPSP